MRRLFLILLVLSSCKTSQVQPSDVVPTPTVEPVVTSSISPPAIDEVNTESLVTYNPSSSIEKSFAQPAIDLMNKAFKSGCLKKKWLDHKFTSFNCVFDKCPKTNIEAYNAYVKGAPYALNLRWYSSLKGVVGYTYNFSDDDWDRAKSETRIWSNSRIVGSYSPKYRAAHWAHELSHQTRAGGFVHYTNFQGSVPYEAGDVMEECI